jgi:thiol-disulfide isomerase/thioredoxin
MKITTITHTLTTIILVLTLIGCQEPANISGNLQGDNQEGSKIYLIQPQSLRAVAGSYFGLVIDSAMVNSNGDFVFQNLPKTTEPILLELAIQPSGKAPNQLQVDDPTTANFMPIAWQIGETIEISAKWNEFQKSFSIANPSEINKALLDLRDTHQNAYQSYLKGNPWEQDGAHSLLAKEHAILQYQTALINFADNTKHLLPALVALRWVSPVNDFERVPEFLVRQCTKWNETQSNHPWVAELCEQSKPSNLPVLLGSEFPNIKLPTMAQDTLNLYKELGSKLTIIDLWASWCAPCRIENRDILVPIWEKHHENGVKIIGFSLEGNAASWESAAEKDGADRWLQASELQGDDTPMLRRIRVRTIPANFILDENGIVLAKNIHGQALINWVNEYLK